MKKLLELIRDLCWCSEIDESWKLKIGDNLEYIRLDNAKTVDLDKFFNQATQYNCLSSCSRDVIFLLISSINRL